MTLLALDIGNSSIKAGLFKGRELLRATHCGLDVPEELESWAGTEVPDAVAMVSVVPDASLRVQSWAHQWVGLRPLELTAASRLPFRMDYLTPKTLGADRVAAAAGAWAMRGDSHRSIVAVDAGTALTIDVVTSAGAYLGGVIAPGPDLLRQALREGTAQLPLVELDISAPLIGRSTAAAMQSGIMNGFARSVEGLLDAIVADLEGSTRIVLTGGWSGFLHSRIRRRTFLAPDLVLEGVRELYAENVP